ncbi:hypothetical protein HBH74_112730 [Parastagonospora nodorum]|nr:hypothetical protein HBH87_127650 [Parastagonospora nodorum]KAH4926594.1 hypothetical protein HBH74_112730 [Parastagonospora nodorum]KAH5061088.1 hypothetical protein HBH96_073700 [Parastagonospora nodorum]KAH5475622.1 hypothetical protein HBI28_096300 [Parastagonospora nodorum]KAH5603258.1 hypothetical protein HBI45_119530 [Parastagonospora nodorum]
MKDILAVNTHTTSRAHQDHITIQSEGLIEDQKVGLAKDPTTLYKVPTDLQRTEGDAKDTFHDSFQIRSLRFNKVVNEEKVDRLTKIVVPCLPEDGEWWDGHVPLLTKRHQDGSIDRPYKYEAMDPIKFHL